MRHHTPLPRRKSLARSHRESFARNRYRWGFHDAYESSTPYGIRSAGRPLGHFRKDSPRVITAVWPADPTAGRRASPKNVGCHADDTTSLRADVEGGHSLATSPAGASSAFGEGPEPSGGASPRPRGAQVGPNHSTKGSRPNDLATGSGRGRRERARSRTRARSKGRGHPAANEMPRMQFRNRRRARANDELGSRPVGRERVRGGPCARSK